jgi:hypothetical protein
MSLLLILIVSITVITATDYTTDVQSLYCCHDTVTATFIATDYTIDDKVTDTAVTATDDTLLLL